MLQTTVIGTALLLATLGFALAPAAEAHTCAGNAGGLGCGPCAPPLAHYHTSLDGTFFCSSSLLSVCYFSASTCLP